MRQSAKCPECGIYISMSEYWAHVTYCGKGSIPKRVGKHPSAYFRGMTHRQVIDFYKDNPSEIEEGMYIKEKEFPVLRGHIDLLGIDKDRRTCIIEVVHKSHYSKKHWVKKLKSYRRHALSLVSLIVRQDPEQLKKSIRLLIVKPGREPKEV